MAEASALKHEFLKAASFPRRMRDAKRWLLWRSMGKPVTKVPCYALPGGEYRKRFGALDGDEDKARLVTYSAAVAAFKAKPDFYTGLGFALGEGWWGVDLDHVREPEHGDALEWVGDLLAYAKDTGKYADVSPSGTGIHIIGFDMNPSKARSGRYDKHVEVYLGKRFFTMTGNHNFGLLGLLTATVRAGGVDELLAMLPPRPALRLVPPDGLQTAQIDAGALQPGKVTSTWLADKDTILTCLANLSADCPRDPWLKVGMAIHHASKGSAEGLAIWDWWSASAGPPRYVPVGRSGSCAEQWASFGKSSAPPVTLGTLIQMSKQACGALIEAAKGARSAQPAPDADPLVAFIQTAGAAQADPAAITRIVPPTYYIEGLLRECVAGALIATGGTGKTSLLLHLAITTATGREWLGRRVLPGSFVLFSRDDAQDDLDYARAQIMGAMALSAAECALVAQRVRLISLRGYFSENEPLTFSRVGEKGMVEATVLAQRLIAGVRAMGLPDLRCAAIDTLRQFAGGSTNDDRVVTVCTQAITQIADGLACAGIVLHHMTKEGARNGADLDQHSGSGSGALGDNSRFVWGLNEIGPGDSKEARMARDQILHESYHLTGQDALDAGTADQVLTLSDTRGALVRRREEAMLILRRGYTFTRLKAPKKSMAQKDDDARRQVLQCLPASGAQIVMRLKGRKQKWTDLLREMIADGLVDKANQNAPYAITAAGKAFFDGGGNTGNT